MAVTTTDIVNFLEKPAQDFLNQADTVQPNINRSQRMVDNVKRTGVNINDEEDAVKALAVWLTYGSYMEGISEQLGGQGVDASMRTKLEHLRRVAQLFMNNIASSAITLNPDADFENMIGVSPENVKMSPTEGYLD